MSEERQTAAAAGTRSYRHLSCSRTRRAGIWGTRRAVLPVLALLLAGGWLRAAAPAPKTRWPEVGFRKTCWDCRKGRWAKRRLSVRQCRMQQGHTATDDVRELCEGPASGSGDARRRQWEERLAELKRFLAENGHCNVSGAIPTGKAQLARWQQLTLWANKQHRMYRMRTLAPDRAAQLEEVGFILENNTSISTWEYHYHELLYFKQSTGHCNVPTGRPTASLSASFIAWVDWQRRSFKAKRASLTPARRSRLDSLGFTWDVKQTWWDDKFAAFVALCKSDGARLGGRWSPSIDMKRLPQRVRTWLYEQRYKLARGSLLPHRKQKLDGSGIKWRAPNQTEAYGRRVEILALYRKENGHCRVPVRYDVTDPDRSGLRIRLGGWCAEQRKQYRHGLLTPNRFQQLMMLGFEWKGAVQPQHAIEGRIATCWLPQLPSISALYSRGLLLSSSNLACYLAQGATRQRRPLVEASRAAPRAAGGDAIFWGNKPGQRTRRQSRKRSRTGPDAPDAPVSDRSLHAGNRAALQGQALKVAGFRQGRGLSASVQQGAGRASGNQGSGEISSLATADVALSAYPLCDGWGCPKRAADVQCAQGSEEHKDDPLEPTLLSLDPPNAPWHGFRPCQKSPCDKLNVRTAATKQSGWSSPALHNAADDSCKLESFAVPPSA